MQFFNCLQFYEYAVFNKVVHAKRRVRRDAVVDDRKLHLVLELQSDSSELTVKTGVVDFLQRSRAYRRMNGHRRFNHKMCDFVDQHSLRALCGPSLCGLSNLCVLGSVLHMKQTVSLH